MENITLNNGNQMPKLGLGVFQMNDQQVLDTIPMALDAGYRLIDTASRYYNEEAVGRAIAESGIAREELFITTKLWFKDHGYDNTKKALQVSLEKLDLDYLDLWLIHQPFNDYYGSWKAMEELIDAGLVRSIGVSNFYADRYADLVAHNRIVPAVNQRETHVFNQQIEMDQLLKQHGTVLQAWAPLAQGNQEAHTNHLLVSIAEQHRKSIAQVMLRWLLQRDITAVVKSTKKHRLRENIDVFDFTLTDEEMAGIAALDKQQPLAGFTHRDPRMLERLQSLD
ncbi:aldo/keto reductase [Corynebacterium glutamicum]|uniref:aldo/keto reductase n=1 Tax=Corynebacterium TaxID=1716 RepID=UPI00071FC8B6|nr:MULTISPECIES: aldo/keto reductase [Corynebacterium]ALP48772.1 2,5-diketo-D-gluconic acid reductase [Corynebacterium glutamicum]ANR61028.1 glyoxal reductase [[Brevibacterium] flavum ZL-1]ANR64027.1 glyoxal reductase [Corynebacterium glutamicum ZL-6]ANU32307.1 2,5-diketo-D-gluconic acid reductase [Corynebacterium glutamicum]APT06056.1 2,5-diketo-D-gluconic acid reductase [Corynebacterium glutamicum]